MRLTVVAATDSMMSHQWLPDLEDLRTSFNMSMRLDDGIAMTQQGTRDSFPLLFEGGMTSAASRLWTLASLENPYTSLNPAASYAVQSVTNPNPPPTGKNLAFDPSPPPLYHCPLQFPPCPPLCYPSAHSLFSWKSFLLHASNTGSCRLYVKSRGKAAFMHVLALLFIRGNLFLTLSAMSQVLAALPILKLPILRSG